MSVNYENEDMKNISLSLDKETLRRVDNYWHDAHFTSRAEALRVLIKTGLSELEVHKSEHSPTENQVKYVKSLCKKNHVAPPSEWSFNAYSEFIQKYTKGKK